MPSPTDPPPPAAANPWDQRFAAEGFAYGTAPSAWLVAQAPRIRPGGRVLCLGEGEGRNAVWLATRGFAIDAQDGSAVGLAKAARLAGRHGVAIATTVADLATYVPAPAAYDAVVLIFLHLPPALRARVHALAAAALAPGGLLILEAFSPAQLGRTSGGPKDAAWLYDAATLRADLPGLRWEALAEAEAVLDEGPLHQGPAALVRAAGWRAA